MPYPPCFLVAITLTFIVRISLRGDGARFRFRSHKSFLIAWRMWYVLALWDRASLYVRGRAVLLSDQSTGIRSWLRTNHYILRFSCSQSVVQGFASMFEAFRSSGTIAKGRGARQVRSQLFIRSRIWIWLFVARKERKPCRRSLRKSHVNWSIKACKYCGSFFGCSCSTSSWLDSRRLEYKHYITRNVYMRLNDWTAD